MSSLTIADLSRIALALASFGLWLWCIVLARRLRRLNDLETGLGGAIAVMAAEVDRLERALAQARSEAQQAGEALGAAVDRARDERARWAMGGPDLATPRARLRRARQDARQEACNVDA